MHFDVVTIFPELFETFRSVGVLGRAVEKGIVGLEAHDLRDWADNKWRQLDDEPYGGGAGMVLQAPPTLAAVRELAERGEPPRTITLGPRGRVFDQKLAACAGGTRVSMNESPRFSSSRRSRSETTSSAVERLRPWLSSRRWHG